MDHIQRTAFESVGRGCGFVWLGIACVMMGVSYDLSVFFQAGAICTLILSLILIYLGNQAMNCDYKRTELWVMLDKNQRPQKQFAQYVLGCALRNAHFYFALVTAIVSILLWSAAILSILFA